MHLLIPFASTTSETATQVLHDLALPNLAQLLALRERAGWQKAAVALANKDARILWAVMTRAKHSTRGM